MAFLDVLFFLRPLLFAPAATMVLLGRDAGRAALADGRVALAAPWSPPSAIAAFVALGLALAATHVANQLADRESDRANAKLPFLSSGVVSSPAARAILALLVAGFAGALAVVPAALRPLEVAALLLGAAYSIPPLALKARFGWDAAANAVGYGGVAFAVGWGSAAPLAWPEVAAGALPWVLAVAGVFAATAVADEPGDRAAGQRTLAVRLGVRGARAAAFALMACAAASAALLSAWTPLLLALASLVPLAIPVVRPSRSADHVAFQASAAIPTLYAAVRHPPFGALLALAVLATRVYFGSRFGIRYPALGAPARRADRSPGS